MDIKNLTQSKSFRIAVIVTGVFLVALLSFSAGVNVGLRKAKFSYAFGEQYERNFGSGPFAPGKGPMMGGAGQMMPFADIDDKKFRNGHGLIGEVISVTDGSLIVEDIFGNENTISFDTKTLVKNGRDNAETSILKAGDRIAVIGKPDEETGTVAARFIRVLPEPAQEQ
jgi:hypothetical protein